MATPNAETRRAHYQCGLIYAPYIPVNVENVSMASITVTYDQYSQNTRQQPCHLDVFFSPLHCITLIVKHKQETPILLASFT